MRALAIARILAIAVWSMFVAEFLIAFLLFAMTLWLSWMPHSSYESLRWLVVTASLSGAVLAILVGHKNAPMLQEIAFRAESSNHEFGGSLIAVAEEMTSNGVVPRDVLGASEMLASQALAKNTIPIPDPPWRIGHASVMCSMALVLVVALFSQDFASSVVEFLWPSTEMAKVLPRTPSPRIAMRGYRILVSHPKLPLQTLESPLEIVVFDGSVLTVIPDIVPLAGVSGVSLRLPDARQVPATLKDGQYKMSVMAIGGLYAVEAEPRIEGSPIFGVKMREDEPPCAAVIVRNGVAECEAADDMGLANARLVICPRLGEPLSVEVALKRGDKHIKTKITLPGDKRMESGFSYYLIAKDITGNITKSPEQKWAPPEQKTTHAEQEGMLERNPRSLARPQKLPSTPTGSSQDNKKGGGRPKVERLDDKPESDQASDGQRAAKSDGYDGLQGLKPEKRPSESNEKGNQDGQAMGGRQESNHNNEEDGEQAGSGAGGQKPRDGGPKSGRETGGDAKPSPPDSVELSRMSGMTPEEATKKYRDKISPPRTDFGQEKEPDKSSEEPSIVKPIDPTGISSNGKDGKDNKEDKGLPRARLDKVDPEYIPMVEGYFRLRKEH